jgi:hypothetical protein
MSLITRESGTEPQSNQANSRTALIDTFPVGTRPRLAVTRCAVADPVDAIRTGLPPAHCASLLGAGRGGRRIVAVAADL